MRLTWLAFFMLQMLQFILMFQIQAALGRLQAALDSLEATLDVW